MKKPLLMVLSIAMVAVCAGCGKESVANGDTVQNVLQGKNGHSADEQLILAVRECLQRCEAAYRQDSALFVQVCVGGNHEAFFSLTDIGEALRQQVIFLHGEKVRTFMRDNPDYELDTVCAGCEDASLSALCGTVVSLSRVLREIAALDAVGRYEPFAQIHAEVSDCELQCKRKFQDTDPRLLECLLNCKLTVCLIDAYEYLRVVMSTHTTEEQQ